MDKLTILEMKEKAPYLEWLMVSAAVWKDKNIDNIWSELPKDGKWNIQLIVNGVELPAIKAFEEIRKQDEYRIKKEAAELLREKFYNLDEVLEDLTQSVISNFSEKLGIEIEDY